MTNTPQINIRLKQHETQWFLDFIKVKNISELSDMERAEMAGVIQKHIHHQRLGESQGNEPVSPELMTHLKGMISPDRLITFQKRILFFFEYLMGRISNVVDQTDRDWTRTEEVDFYPNLNGVEIGINYRLQVEGLRYEKKMENEKAIAYKFIPESLKGATITAYQDPSVEVEYFLLSFLNLINGIPIMAFKECAECKDWFVNLTKKSKLFCRNKCAARHGQKIKRAEKNRKIETGDPEAIEKHKIELARARKRASDLYEAKVKKETPGAKVEKRPRKPYPKE
ncbi:MAG: hypothetical protein FP816_18880 [Desulfobacteraceae bacterium]|nr:hypothetical protein [Desulfobacteraceae bacterium]